MKSFLFAVFGMLHFPFLYFAQISPTPVINNEIKDNTSIRMRSIELERVKRDANRLRQPETSRETEIRFAEIKDDFEHIQKLQSTIIKAYTTGENINYEKIRESALEMKKRAVRLSLNFFNLNTEIEEDKDKNRKKTARKNVRDLIIELDRTMGDFVTSPVFRVGKKIESEMLEKSELNLEKIIKLSDRLSRIE